ncbi:unnamed protein product [Pleuronectes platessa]|uniref:Uncharacterized protein n=1 Tax=Pleuronectes platessa TaxID=8262 RepID=A0A9N7TR98_PLEPL|nr:unnamed protein product [Pleuronectes platessa]
MEGELFDGEQCGALMEQKVESGMMPRKGDRVKYLGQTTKMEGEDRIRENSIFCNQLCNQTPAQIMTLPLLSWLEPLFAAASVVAQNPYRSKDIQFADDTTVSSTQLQSRKKLQNDLGPYSRCSPGFPALQFIKPILYGSAPYLDDNQLTCKHNQ